MKIAAKKSTLSGRIMVPASKSHTIRALLLAAMAEGTSHIKNPLKSADCLSTGKVLPLIGAEVSMEGEGTESVWTVKGAGKNMHLPEDVVNVGDSGSLLYFLSAIASTFEGWSVFTGDESIRRRPVHHVAEALSQLGAECHITRPGEKSCPLLIKGPVSSGKVVTAGEVSSQYISGLMMAALRVSGGIEIELTNPKETPYLTMTQKWLEETGASVYISPDFKKIKVDGVHEIKAFDKTVPSDWEAVAFPLVAAVITGSSIVIEGVDSSGTQGDDAVVAVLESLGAKIDWNKEDGTLTVHKASRLSTEKLPGGELRVKISPFPDAICALAVAACFTEGRVVIEDAAVCRRKETDRIKVMTSILRSLGADVEEGEDFMIINGHSPYLSDGSVNPEFKLHGGNVESHDDHRIAMSLACLALALPEGEEIVINNAECCAVSFPDFYNVMNKIGTGFKEV
ncbi:MAG: 3-phosphoshikimate 1-carboxyvinyltransferase [Treponema sp.]|nr:3-phosphoshikimate 1-carboxyvinyltransferase [Treponema sp.]